MVQRWNVSILTYVSELMLETLHPFQSFILEGSSALYSNAPVLLYVPPMGSILKK